MTSNAKEQIMEWLTGSDTCFLIGAGCSACAGKPLIGRLTEQVLEDAKDKLLQQFRGLRQIGDRPATIEDLINFLLRYRDILEATVDGAHPITIDEIDKWLTQIKEKIVSNIDDDWKASPYHQRFLLRVCSQRRPRDIFSLNYDTLLEASLDELRLPYTDGFRGTERAWFDPEVFNETNTIMYRIFKLHGSVNWTRDDENHVRRGRGSNRGATEPIVVYPSEQKYLQTQYGIYETLIGQFRNRLRELGANNYLVVLGYSFNDAHITEAICDSINADKNNLTVVAFVGPESDRDKQNDRLQKIGDRCDSRFNAFVGSGETAHFVGQAVDEDLARAILNSDLWKFEKLVEFIAGAAS